jgi:hypothetical protein
MQKKKVPTRLWDYGLVYESELLSRMARGKDGRTGYEEVTGNTADISEWLDFEFYDLVWWWDRPKKPDVTDETRRLGRWLGVSHRVRSDLCYWVVTESGHVVSKTSVEHVTRDDYLNPDTKTKIELFNKELDERLDDTNFALPGEEGVDLKFLEDIDDDNLFGSMAYNNLLGIGGVTPTVEEYGDMVFEERPEDDDEEAIDKYLNMELILGAGTDDQRRGRVVKRARGIDGEYIGHSHSNPLFDTRQWGNQHLNGGYLTLCVSGIVSFRRSRVSIGR